MGEKFLDKVVGQIMFETELKYGFFNGREQWYVKFPFNDSPWEYDIFTNYSFHIVVGNEFSTHCRNIYGLNNDEINYVIKEFGKKLKDLKPSTTINENIDKQKQFLNRVLEQIVSETSVDFNLTQERWVSIFTPMVSYPIFSSQPTENPFKRVFHYPMFKRHCKEVYGLNDIETEHLFSLYNRVISDKINNG